LPDSPSSNLCSDLKNRVLEIKKLHELLSARAFLRAALNNVRWARIYVDSRSHFTLKEDLVTIEELLEAAIERLDKEIGFMVYGPQEEHSDERVKAIIRAVILGEAVGR